MNTSLRDRYNAYYRENPQIWDNPSRDAFAHVSLSRRIPWPPATMLDIGCGSGHTIAYFHERCPETLFTGVDLSGEAIAIAERRAPYANLVDGDFKALDLPAFDLVTLLGVLEHFESLEEGLQAVRKTAAPGGFVYVEVPNCLSYPGAAPEEEFRPASIGSGQPEWHLRRETWEWTLQDAGFEIRDSLRGHTPMTEFVWILARKEG